MIPMTEVVEIVQSLFLFCRACDHLAWTQRARPVLGGSGSPLILLVYPETGLNSQTHKRLRLKPNASKCWFTCLLRVTGIHVSLFWTLLPLLVFLGKLDCQPESSWWAGYKRKENGESLGSSFSQVIVQHNRPFSSVRNAYPTSPVFLVSEPSWKSCQTLADSLFSWLHSN